MVQQNVWTISECLGEDIGLVQTNHPFTNQFLDLGARAQRLYHSSLIKYGEYVVIDSAFTSRQRMRVLVSELDQSGSLLMMLDLVLSSSMFMSTRESSVLRRRLPIQNPKSEKGSAEPLSSYRDVVDSMNLTWHLDEWSGSCSTLMSGDSVTLGVCIPIVNRLTLSLTLGGKCVCREVDLGFNLVDDYFHCEGGLKWCFINCCVRLVIL
jgi:hypothetical protein